MYGDEVSDLFNEFIRIFKTEESQKAEAEKKFYDDSLLNFLKIFENIIGKNGSGFLTTSGLTWADLYLFDVLSWLGDKRETILADYPHIMNLMTKVSTHARIADWLAKRPKTRI